MAWEDAHVSLGSRYSPSQYDPAWRQVFATLVLHHWRHAAFLRPTALRDGMSVLHRIPGVLIHGKLDVSGPAVGARELHKPWPRSQFVPVDDKRHGGPKMNQAMMAAIAALTEAD
jgi:proline iminopeptidase